MCKRKNQRKAHHEHQLKVILSHWPQPTGPDNFQFALLVEKASAPGYSLENTRRQSPCEKQETLSSTEFEKAANNATDADIKQWASSTLPTLRTHLDHALMCQENAKKM